MSLINPSPIEQPEREIYIGHEIMIQYRPGLRPGRSQGYRIKTEAGNEYQVITFEEGENYLRIVLTGPGNSKFIPIRDLDEVIRDLAGGGLG